MQHRFESRPDGTQACSCGLVYRPGADAAFVAPTVCAYAVAPGLYETVEAPPTSEPPRVRGERTVIDPPRSRTWPAGIRANGADVPTGEAAAAAARRARVRLPGERQRGLSPMRPAFWRPGMSEPILFWTQHWKAADFQDRAFQVSPRRIYTAAELLRTGRPAGIRRSPEAATCPICGRSLGEEVLTDGALLWPAGAEHYILGHAIWTPELELLLEGKEIATLGAVRLPKVFRDNCERWS